MAGVWELKNGNLCNRSLSHNYFWRPAEIVITAYCQCPAHAEIRKIRYQEAVNDEESHIKQIELRLDDAG
jgi:hypothetical protein